LKITLPLVEAVQVRFKITSTMFKQTEELMKAKKKVTVKTYVKPEISIVDEAREVYRISMQKYTNAVTASTLRTLASEVSRNTKEIASEF
jgi:hypothetical protein